MRFGLAPSFSGKHRRIFSVSTGPLTVVLLIAAASPGQADKNDVASRVVKVIGTSSRGSIEAFETGLLISSTGDVVTVASPILESKNLHIVLFDNRSFPAKLLATDAKRQIAYLRTTAADLPFFDLAQSAPPPKVGDIVWGSANRVDLMQAAKPIEPLKLTLLRMDEPKVGVNSSDRRTSHFIVEGMPNRAGAFGGALTNESDQLIGMIASSEQVDPPAAPIRRAIPASEIRDSISDILQGKGSVQPPRSDGERPASRRSTSNMLRGIILLPEVLDQTPAFVDGIEPDSPSHQVNLLPDDLILYVGSTLVRSTDDLRHAFSSIPANSPIPLVFLRDDQLMEVELKGQAP